MLTKQKFEKFAATLFWLKKFKQEIKFLYDIQVTYFYVFFPWIFLSTLGPRDHIFRTTFFLVLKKIAFFHHLKRIVFRHNSKINSDKMLLISIYEHIITITNIIEGERVRERFLNLSPSITLVMVMSVMVGAR